MPDDKPEVEFEFRASFNGGLFLLAISLIFGGAVGGNWDEIRRTLWPQIQFNGVAVGFIAAVLYPLAGTVIAFTICSPLLWWATGEPTPRFAGIWFAALWPLAVPLCVVICPAVGLIRILFSN